MVTINRKWLEEFWSVGEAGRLPDWADVEWYAVDENGFVALFTSAGPGPIPRAVFRDLDKYIAMVDYLKDLPIRGKHELLIRYLRVTDYTQAADRGLFAFNYDSGRAEAPGYRLVARPSDPLPHDTLPPWLRDLLEVVRIESAMFARSQNTVIDLSRGRLELLS
jgi:hypothetical protein